MIREGKHLLLAGDIGVLSGLPEGNWIGGTTTFFIQRPSQRINSTDKIFVCELPEYVVKTVIREYDAASIRHIYTDAPENGFTVLIMPFNSPPSREFAFNAGSFSDFAARPVCGWVAGGYSKATILTDKCYAASGAGNRPFTDKAVAMHITFPENKYAELCIFNPYKQGTGDEITFDYSSMIAKDAFINGKKRNLAAYLRETGFVPNVPFVANYAGAMLNVECFAIENDEVFMAAPFFPGITYKISEIDGNIADPELTGSEIIFSVTCIVNYMNPDFCERYLTKMNGPVVYGEIAYQLLNQTTVYVTSGDVQR
jgi:hypothetical protein